MLTKSNGKGMTELIVRIIGVVVLLCGVVYATSVMVSKPGNTFAEDNKGLPVKVQGIKESLEMIAKVAEKLQDLPAQVEYNRKDLEKLSDIPKDLALTIQAMKTLGEGLGRVDKQVRQNTRMLLNLR